MGLADRREHHGRSHACDQRCELRARLRPAHRQGTLASARVRRSPRPPIYADGFVIASGCAPGDITACGAHGDVTPGAKTSNRAVWSKTGAGVRRRHWPPGCSCFRGRWSRRLRPKDGGGRVPPAPPHRSGYKARRRSLRTERFICPVRTATCGRPNGATRAHRDQPMGELLAATPALSEGRYVRSPGLFAVGHASRLPLMFGSPGTGSSDRTWL